MDSVQLLLKEIGDFFGNDSVARGAVVVGGTALAVLLSGVRWFKKKPQDRVQIHVDAPHGQRVKIELGEDEGA